jgi:aryl-alcohol dehydrogenase-like predicted oxidoreductase
MEYRAPGRTGLQVSAVGFSGWGIGGGFRIASKSIGYGSADDLEAIAAISTVVKVGINLFDTADAYGAGHSECLIGQILRAIRPDAIVATKVGLERRDPFPSRKNFECDYILRAGESSLRRLRHKVIDIYQLHNPGVDVVRSRWIWEALEELKNHGKIKFFGVSVSSPEEGVELIHAGNVDILQVEYDIFHRGCEDELLPFAEERKIGVLARTPLAWGYSRASSQRRPCLKKPTTEAKLCRPASCG